MQLRLGTRCSRFSRALFILPIIVFYSLPNEVANLNSNFHLERQFECRKSGSWIKTKLPAYNYSAESCTIDYRQSCKKSKSALYRWSEKKGCTKVQVDKAVLENIFASGSIYFVGDSLARNMKESLACIVSSYDNPGIISYYNAYIPFQISSSKKKKGVKERKIDLRSSIFSQGSNSEGKKSDLSEELENISVLVIVFGHHFNAPFNRFEGPRMSLMKAYELGVRTMIKDLENISFKSPVIWVSYSPSHFDSGWNMGGSCSSFKVPSKKPHVFKQAGYSARDWNRALLNALEDSPATHYFLDITTPSEFRSDAHPNKMILKTRQDCVHWCLPGVADTWNELLIDIIIKIRASPDKKGKRTGLPVY